MPRYRWGIPAKAAALVLAVSAFGLAVRFALVHVPRGYDVSGMCAVTSDFRRGDRALC